MNIRGLSAQIRDDLQSRFPSQRKTQRDKLSVLVATMLEVGSGQVMELAHSLPLKSCESMTRFQWIKRFLGNEHVDVDEVMSYYSRDLLQQLHDASMPIELMLDQSTVQAFERHELVMIALRVGKRAIPICWRIHRASGSLGWTEQCEVLELARSLLPEGAQVTLMGDRFYGHAEMIAWCQSAGWDYFLRLKGSLMVSKDRDTKPQDRQKLIHCYEEGHNCLREIYLTNKMSKTNIQMIKDPESSDPWIIAMSCPPTPEAAREYARRWGIEAMFSDLKTRGFNLNQSQLRKTDRINRLIMVMAIALYWAVSTGLWKKEQEGKKNAISITELWFLSSKQD